jgi:ATP-binding cassette, subfamily B, bacterial MsbA
MSTPSIDLIKEFTDENAGLMFAYFFLNIVTLILETIAMSILLSKLFSSLGQKEQTDKVKYYLVMFVVVFILVRLGDLFRSIVYDEIIPKFFYFLRTKLYNKIIDRYQIDYKELNIGYILYNFEHLPSSFKRLMTELLKEYIPNVLAILVCVCYLFYTNKMIGGIVLAGLVIFIIITVCTIKDSVSFSSEEHQAFEHDNEHIQDRLSNLFDIYTAGTEQQEKQEFKELEDDLKATMVGYFRHITGVITGIEVFITIVLALSFMALFKAYKDKTMNNEYIISTILVLTYFLSYFSKIAGNYIGISDVFGYSQESDRFIKEIRALGSPAVPLDFSSNLKNSLHGPIEFRNVSFKYPNTKNKKVLNGTNLYIKPGTKIAIYGKSGSGKSTLIKLLLGFYGIESGTITFGGKNLKDISIHELRKNISVVNQNIKLFDKTIFENMTYGINDQLSDLEIQQTIESIIGNPNIFEGVIDGLNSGVGVSGSKLSGGQKQIINIIRAILKDAPILILDEPTSALDQSTKKLIIKTINKLKGKTVIIITHDSSILSIVDRAYELANGKLKMI